MTHDDATRRQLRFALFLQVAGFVMFLVAFVMRFLANGFDAITFVFALAMAVVAAAMIATRRQLHQ